MMILFIICWTNARGVPDMDVFTDAEQAQRCLAFVTENCNNAIMRKIEIRKEEEPAAEEPAAEEPQEEPIELPVEEKKD